MKKEKAIQKLKDLWKEIEKKYPDSARLNYKLKKNQVFSYQKILMTV